MSFVEALLLDPYRMDLWVAMRTDGVAGTGTQNDPFDGSTQAKFDAIMSGVAANTCIHLGPGMFQTNGYSDGASGGWQPKAATRIVGSGVDITTLKLAGSSANAHFYAVGHAVSSGGQPNSLDFVEVADLTIDCNLGGFSGASAACGAVRLFGNHTRVRRIKVINWGTRSTSRASFVISVITATDLAWVEDCGIEECIAVNPASSSNTGPMTVFHCGGTESPPTNPVAYGVAPYIRNCFADSGQSYPFSLEVRGLSLAWCKAGIIEGNQIHNVSYGVYQQTANAQDILIRNNWFKNVNKGVLLGNLGAMSGSGTLAESMSVATVTISAGHMLSIGDSALLNTTGAYNGIVVTVQSASFSNTTFTFGTSKTTGDTVNSVQKVFGVGNASRLGNFPAPGSLLIEGNVVELATATSGSGIIALHLNDSWAASTPSQDPSNPYYVFSNVVIRDNKLRYLDGTFESNYVGYGMQLNSAANLLVRNNVIESAPTSPPPMQNDRCGAVGYFNNQWPSGVLIQGVSGDNGTKYDELSTEADDALVMGLFNKKS
ncbi:MAG TPA: hypothetical protein VG146_09250 [Verrucomicrobiae bacterium]|nr:hypothetical protein [Verrucomicrobiae bacterium]